MRTGLSQHRNFTVRRAEVKSFRRSLPPSVSTVLLSSPVLGQQPGGPGYGPHMWEGGWHWMFFGPVMMIVFIAVAVALVVLVIRWLGGPTHGRAPPQAPARKEPIDILKERYAKGEIDKDEFEERRRVLGE